MRAFNPSSVTLVQGDPVDSSQMRQCRGLFLNTKRTEIETTFQAGSDPRPGPVKLDGNYCCFGVELLSDGDDGDDGDGGTELPLLVSIPPGEVAPPVAEPVVKPK